MWKIGLIVAVIGAILDVAIAFLGFGLQAILKITMLIVFLFCFISVFFVPLFWSGIIRIGIGIGAITIFKAIELL